jgi:hypothetical protein
VSPPQSPTIVPRWVSPLAPHTAAFRMRPPSRGSPGTRFTIPTKRLVHASPEKASPISPSETTEYARKATRETPSEDRGPTTDTQNSWRGVSGSPSMEVMPPKNCRVMLFTGSPNRLAISACDASCTSTDR